jgi:hypothetical protein
MDIIVNDNVTVTFKLSHSMSAALAFFGDRANWPLAPECKAYRLGLDTVEIDFCQTDKWSDSQLAVLYAQTQRALHEFTCGYIDRLHGLRAGFTAQLEAEAG